MTHYIFEVLDFSLMFSLAGESMAQISGTFFTDPSLTGPTNTNGLSVRMIEAEYRFQLLDFKRDELTIDGLTALPGAHWIPGMNIPCDERSIW